MAVPRNKPRYDAERSELHAYAVEILARLRMFGRQKTMDFSIVLAGRNRPLVVRVQPPGAARFRVRLVRSGIVLALERRVATNPWEWEVVIPDPVSKNAREVLTELARRFREWTPATHVPAIELPVVEGASVEAQAV